VAKRKKGRDNIMTNKTCTKLLLSRLFLVGICAICGCSLCLTLTGCGRRNNPVTPAKELEIIGNCVTPGYAKDLFVLGDYAYVADGQAGLQVIDISDPTQPVIAGSHDTDKYAYGIFVQDSIAYVADGASGGGLHIFNVKHPDSIIALGTDAWISVYDVFVINRDASVFALLAARDKFVVDEVTNPLLPSLEGRCETPGTAYGVYGNDEYAYVANEQMGLQVIDMTELTDPEISGSCDTPGKALDVFVSGDYAYIADGREGLQVIDVSDPERPGIVGTCNTPGYANRIFVFEARAYIADGDAGLQVIDVSNPSSPSIVGECDTPYANGVFVTTGRYVYVSDRDEGLVVIGGGLTIRTPGRGG
jgi:hypothetical protein